MRVIGAAMRVIDTTLYNEGDHQYNNEGDQWYSNEDDQHNNK